MNPPSDIVVILMCNLHVIIAAMNQDQTDFLVILHVQYIKLLLEHRASPTVHDGLGRDPHGPNYARATVTIYLLGDRLHGMTPLPQNKCVILHALHFDK